MGLSNRTVYRLTSIAAGGQGSGSVGDLEENIARPVPEEYPPPPAYVEGLGRKFRTVSTEGWEELDDDVRPGWTEH
jgi:hypothetical protein